MIKIDWLRDINTGKEINYLNISNILSAIRFSLVPLLITMFGLLIYVNEHFKIKIIIFIFAAIVCLTDLFDGFLARTFNQVTNLGKVLDPVGDFLMIICFSVLAYTNNVIEWWFFLLIMIRIPGLLIVIIFLMILDLKFKLKTTLLGKASIFYILCLLGLSTLKLLLSFENYYYNLFLFFIQIIGAILLIVSSIEKILLLIYYIKNQDRIDLTKDNIQF
jgi:phosphatidylglycerophosphate synthase